MYLILPVPVVLLLKAFLHQLSVKRKEVRNLKQARKWRKDEKIVKNRSKKKMKWEKRKKSRKDKTKQKAKARKIPRKTRTRTRKKKDKKKNEKKTRKKARQKTKEKQKKKRTLPQLGTREPAGPTGTLLDVKRATATATTQGVCLVVALSKTLSSLGLFTSLKRES